ncbi:histidine phosphatase family protein [Halioglobus japonicus]|uniref:Histidine phosphatase family protein n=1 Tax=Halioglobus japonicus TaxID=930805 RepID=A0AAP8SPY5_9GAMM|nr:histidine phosphatase family protein [Halioglobus japonicus]AQA20312.1 histidine phosphatase family protein [Halioglobus japonicus]PLW88157.1 histidine phosphatase family protein [Halioglobus japonicus]GHD07158.1 phosphoglycerate mutase [Halioglobus japonicus]
MSDKKTYRQTKFVRPAGATEILLIRHGESRAASEDNPFPLVNGQGDPELAATGRDQAEKLAQRLADHAIDAVYVTNLRRTRETAAPLCKIKGIVPGVVEDLREVHLGDWEGGVFRIKAHQNHPSIVEMYERQEWGVIPGAESNSEVDARVARGLEHIISKHPDQMVAVVVHGGVIGSVLAQATRSEPFAFVGADNGSISHLVAHRGRLSLRRFNDTSHLSLAIGSDTSMPT